MKAHPDIKIEYNTEIVRVEGDTSVKKIVFKNALSGKEWTYENTDTIGIFIFAGYLPQTDMVKKQLICDKQGYLLTDEENAPMWRACTERGMSARRGSGSW